MDRKELDLERLHRVHSLHVRGTPEARSGNTELMVQNICSTVEVYLKDEKSHSIGVSCHSYKYWKQELIRRITKELHDRGLDYIVVGMSRIKVGNIIIRRHKKSDKPSPEFLYEDYS